MLLEKFCQIKCIGAAFINAQAHGFQAEAMQICMMGSQAGTYIPEDFPAQCAKQGKGPHFIGPVFEPGGLAPVKVAVIDNYSADGGGAA